jgi:putative hydrolase of the HAD superfamily
MNLGVYSHPIPATPLSRAHRVLLFDWGDTLMRVFQTSSGPMATWPRVEAMPYAVATLSKLYPTFTICLATNAADSNESEIRAALARVNLDRYLDRIFCARSIGYKKPHPAYFANILEQLNLGPSQVVMIGDDYEADIPGALYSGLHAIWLHPYPSPHPAHPRLQVIPDLSQLPAAVYLLF